MAKRGSRGKRLWNGGLSYLNVDLCQLLFFVNPDLGTLETEPVNYSCGVGAPAWQLSSAAVAAAVVTSRLLDLSHVCYCCLLLPKNHSCWACLLLCLLHFRCLFDCLLLKLLFVMVAFSADAAADAAAVAVVSRTTCSEGLGLWTVVVAVASSALHCQSWNEKNKFEIFRCGWGQDLQNGQKAARCLDQARGPETFLNCPPYISKYSIIIQFYCCTTIWQQWGRRIN